MSTKKILIDGLIAGAVISISALTMVPVVGNEMDVVLADRGLPPLSNWAMVYFCSISFVFGISLVGLYAFLRPHFSSRIKAVLTSSLVLWILLYFINNVSLAVYGFIPLRLCIIGIIWGLMELLLAGMITSKLYERR